MVVPTVRLRPDPMRIAAPEGDETMQLSGSATAAEWRYVDSLANSARINDIWFIDPTRGWLVDSNGVVRRTDNGGMSWTPQLALSGRSMGNPYLCTIAFADCNVGWCGAQTSGRGDYTKVLLHHTDNGGTTWRSIDNLPRQTPSGISGLAAVNSSVVYGIGSSDPARNHAGPLGAPAIVKSIDGGKSWCLLDMVTLADNLADIHFFDERHGYVVGGRRAKDCPGKPPESDVYSQYSRLKPVILKTIDGGSTWTDVIAPIAEKLPCGSWACKVFVLDTRRIFVSLQCSSACLMVATLDGVTWQVITANSNTRVGFVDQNSGWVCGPSGVEFLSTFGSAIVAGGNAGIGQGRMSGSVSGELDNCCNRYRFFETKDGLVGYCAGASLYKFSQLGRQKCTAVESMCGFGSGVSALPMVNRSSTNLNVALSCQPASGVVRISFEVPSNTRHVFVGIWSHFGWHVRTVIDEAYPKAGTHTIDWDGTDVYGKPLHGSTQIFRIACDDTVESRASFLPL